MYRLNPEYQVWSLGPCLCHHPQHSENLDSVMLSHQEEEEEVEEEAEEHPTVCCYTSGAVISQAADARWSISSEVPIHFPGSCGLAGQGPSALPSEQSITVIDCDRRDLSQHIIGGQCWEGRGMETQECVCVYGQREPEALDPCWPGSPYIYCGLRRNLVVGVEVVEEISVEDTLEVITEDIYTDDLLDPDPEDLLQDDHL